MKTLPLAGLLGLATLGAQAQALPSSSVANLESFVVTATRSLAATETLREAIVISREEIEAAGALSLGELLQRRAGIELRATGGPGQPQGLFIRGAGSAHTLVLIDGLRAGSATVGTTSIENIPLELIERIEVVKGPLSSLYGSDAIGGVVQIFTRGKNVPHLFATTAYGSDDDRRLVAGLSTVDAGTSLAISAGARKVNAPSAANSRAICHQLARAPYENAFANLTAAQQLWQGETLALEAFGSRGRTAFDGCGSDDRNDQTLSGARLTSSTNFAPWWASRLSWGQGRDKIVIHGMFPNRFETRQDQASWVNEFAFGSANVLAGAEALRQKVLSDPQRTIFTRDKRATNSGFVGLTSSWEGQHLEASARRDQDDAFGKHQTGSVSYGLDWPGMMRLSGTYGRGFRAPSFFDLYGPTSDFYRPNPGLLPERSTSRELVLRSDARAGLKWRLTIFDNRISDLITYVFPTVENVKRANIRGAEVSLETVWLGVNWRADLTAQRPRDEDSGKRLQGRAERFGTLEASKRFGPWSGALVVLASGQRFDSTSEAPDSRLPGYAIADARARYAIDTHWSIELSATNLFDKKYETAVGYNAPRRGLFFTVRFEAF